MLNPRNCDRNSGSIPSHKTPSNGRTGQGDEQPVLHKIEQRALVAAPSRVTYGTRRFRLTGRVARRKQAVDLIARQARWLIREVVLPIYTGKSLTAAKSKTFILCILRSEARKK
jgi:hypothetical protein